jgi:hypothetical protein
MAYRLQIVHRQFAGLELIYLILAEYIRAYLLE